jgi:hypothetical protein
MIKTREKTFTIIAFPPSVPGKFSRKELMIHSKTKQPHVLFLFSDTGGGHRSTAEAIIGAINLDFPNLISTEMVDFFKEYAPPVI